MKKVTLLLMLVSLLMLSVFASAKYDPANDDCKTYTSNILVSGSTATSVCSEWGFRKEDSIRKKEEVCYFWTDVYKKGKDKRGQFYGCVLEFGCPSKLSSTETTITCKEEDNAPKCPPKYDYNKQTGNCDPVPVNCNNGYEFNKKLGICDCPAPKQENTTKDGLKQCLTVPECKDDERLEFDENSGRYVCRPPVKEFVCSVANGKGATPEEACKNATDLKKVYGDDNPYGLKYFGVKKKGNGYSCLYQTETGRFKNGYPITCKLEEKDKDDKDKDDKDKDKDDKDKDKDDKDKDDKDKDDKDKDDKEGEGEGEDSEGGEECDPKKEDCEGKGKGDGEGNGKCDPKKENCNEEPEKIDVPFNDNKLPEPKSFDKDYVKVSAKCPADVKRRIPIGKWSVDLVFPMSPICDFARDFMRPVLIFLAYIYSALSIGNMFKVG